ncbi:predicted protein [Naegleria gruberi]|uniref:Predicted protein n=1 Tax=Naegleria gruberi TaxID=5762 RepID=D2VC65_NAEGR|nr:uncharacterized protein NAEGRDRAFT_57767 [Naegleria gruberi]EFC45693.1 predicted protein [Naegleria gruberi]|eukprot:XP_002678437.1 predicted protein [Naegleria gruberi strain NEG-M]
MMNQQHSHHQHSPTNNRLSSPGTNGHSQPLPSMILQDMLPNHTANGGAAASIPSMSYGNLLGQTQQLVGSSNPNVSDEQAFLLLQQQRDLIEQQKEQIALLQASIQSRLLQQQMNSNGNGYATTTSNIPPSIVASHQQHASSSSNGVSTSPLHSNNMNGGSLHQNNLPPLTHHHNHGYHHQLSNNQQHHSSTTSTAFAQQPNFVIPQQNILPSLQTFQNPPPQQHVFTSNNQTPANFYISDPNFNYPQHHMQTNPMYQQQTGRKQVTLFDDFDELFADGCFEYGNTPPANNVNSNQEQLFNTALNNQFNAQQFVIPAGQEVLPATPLTSWLRIPDQDSMFYRNSYDYNAAFETSPGILAAASSIVPQQQQEMIPPVVTAVQQQPSRNVQQAPPPSHVLQHERRGPKRKFDDVDENITDNDQSKKIKQFDTLQQHIQNPNFEFLDVGDVSVDSTSTDATNNIMNTMMASFFPTDPNKGLDLAASMTHNVPGNSNSYSLLNKLKYVNNSITIVLLNGDPIIECIKFTPKKKMTFELLSLLEVDPIVLASLTGYQYDIYLDQSLLLRYGKRSTSNGNESKQTLDAYQLYLTAQITVDGKELKEIDEYFKFKTVLKNQKALNFKIEQLGNDTRWNEQIVGTNINSRLSFDIEVKMVKPIKGITINLLLFLQQQVPTVTGDVEMETLLRWNVPVLVQGSRRKKKTEKDSELKECFGERMWPLVDLQMALLNRKHAENADPEMDPGEDGYGLMDDILKTRSENVFRPIGDSVLNEIVKEAENNLCKDSNNLHALRLFEKYFQQKYFSGTSLEILNLTRYLAAKTLNKDYMLPDIQPSSLDGDISASLITPGACTNRNMLNNILPEHITELDLNILLKLTYLYSRYEPIFKADGCNNTEKMIKYCCQLATNSQFSIKTKVFSLYRLAESEYLKLNIDKTRLSYQSLEKCNQCYFFIQRCLKEEPTMTKGDVRHIKALEASVLNLKSILLSNIHNLEHFASTPNIATEQEINEKLMSLRDIIQYKHAAFQIRGRYTPKCTSFAQICNNVAASLRVYFMLFKMTSKYTPKRAIAMLNVIKKMQSRAVTVHKQANPNTSHLAYSLYKYNLKTTDLLMLEEMKADDPNENELDEKIEKAAADKRKSYSNYRALKDQFLGQ